jgi:hypothetical protein
MRIIEANIYTLRFVARGPTAERNGGLLPGLLLLRTVSPRSHPPQMSYNPFFLHQGAFLCAAFLPASTF